MQKEEVERQTVYRSPLVANFLMDLLKSGKDIEPKSDIAHGYRYQNVEELIGKNTAETKDFLKNLASIGVLSEKLSDMVIFCPSCNSADVSVNYLCPFCGSPRVVRNALIEHIVCGYIDAMSVFRVNGDLICPKCKTNVGKDDYRSAGRWYECARCKKKIENPQIGHTCRTCRTKFSFDDAKYIEVYNYGLSEVALAEIKGGALFSSLAKSYFKTDGSTVPKSLKGESGVEQEFDVLLKTKDGKYVAIDHLFSLNPLTQAEIMREYGKAFDAKVELYVIAAQVAEDAVKMAKNLGVKLVVGELQESMKRIEDEIKPLLVSGGEVSLPVKPQENKKKFGKFFKKE